MITLLDDWYLDADPRQYILISWCGEYQYDKNGKSKGMKNAEYFYIQKLSSVFDVLLTKLIRKAIKSEEILTLQQMEDRIFTEIKRLKQIFPETEDAFSK